MVRMHDGEVVADTALVRRLLAEQLPHWAGQPLSPVPSAGTDNALFRLGDDLAVRLPRVDWAVDDVHKEQRWLPRLADALPLPIPAPVAMGEPGAGYPWHWSVYRWIDGVNPGVGELDDPHALAADLAGFVAALHRIDPSGGPAASRGIPLAQRDQVTRRSVHAARDLLDAGAVLAAWDEALAAPVWTGPPVWVHGDLSPGNLLCTGGRLSAVIDFGALGTGDPACDLIVAWNLLPAGARDTYRAPLAVDDATWARGRGWALSVALLQLPYYRDTNPALVASSHHVIAEVLADARA